LGSSITQSFSKPYLFKDLGSSITQSFYANLRPKDKEQPSFVFGAQYISCEKESSN
jgi:hypothetical protein